MEEKKNNLFALGNHELHSGKQSKWKIECDALTGEDYKTLAWIVAKDWGIVFGDVVSIPTGGNRFAEKLIKYRKREASSTILIVDDVLSTGESMNKFYDLYPMKLKIGIVVFARGKCPKWVRSIFQYTENDRE